MTDTVLTDFIKVRMQRGLVKQAEKFCARWEEGHIDQDKGGDVYIYNTEVQFAAYAWRLSTAPPLTKFQRMGRLKAARLWQSRRLSGNVFLQPRSALSIAQQEFLGALVESGLAEKIKGFLQLWEHDAWSVMEAGGSLFLCNAEPEASVGGCATRGETTVPIRLETLRDPHLD